MVFKFGKVEFSWSDDKNSKNIKNHGVTFQEAVTIFFNVPLKVVYDPDHSDHEDRYLAIGISIKNRTLIVVHCESTHGNKVRIISARKATKNEQMAFLGVSK